MRVQREPMLRSRLSQPLLIRRLDFDGSATVFAHQMVMMMVVLTHTEQLRAVEPNRIRLSGVR